MLRVLPRCVAGGVQRSICEMTQPTDLLTRCVGALRDLALPAMTPATAVTRGPNTLNVVLRVSNCVYIATEVRRQRAGARLDHVVDDEAGLARDRGAFPEALHQQRHQDRQARRLHRLRQPQRQSAPRRCAPVPEHA